MARGLRIVAIVALGSMALAGAARAQDDAEATIEALQTQVAELTTPTVVPHRSTPTPRAGSRYPDAVAEIVEQDSATGCDEIGWVLGSEDSDEADTLHHAACIGESFYLMQCYDITDVAETTLFGPPHGSLWVGCQVSVGNWGTTDIDVNPLFFSLVTADNQRHSVSFDPIAALPDVDLLPSTSVPQDQSVKGMIYFSVDQTDQQPFRVEIEPLTFAPGDQERGIVIVDELIDSGAL